MFSNNGCWLSRHRLPGVEFYLELLGGHIINTYKGGVCVCVCVCTRVCYAFKLPLFSSLFTTPPPCLARTAVQVVHTPYVSVENNTVHAGLRNAKTAIPYALHASCTPYLMLYGLRTCHGYRVRGYQVQPTLPDPTSKTMVRATPDWARILDHCITQRCTSMTRRE